jgi:hypothetical protein
MLDHAYAELFVRVPGEAPMRASFHCVRSAHHALHRSKTILVHFGIIARQGAEVTPRLNTVRFGGVGRRRARDRNEARFWEALKPARTSACLLIASLVRAQRPSLGSLRDPFQARSDAGRR